MNNTFVFVICSDEGGSKTEHVRCAFKKAGIHYCIILFSEIAKYDF